MAFGQSYVGDTVATGILINTINRVQSIIPGVTVKAGLANLIQANSAEFYYDFAPVVESATVGADFDTAQRGNKKATLVLERALHIDEQIPNVAIGAVSYDLIQSVMAKGAIAIANAMDKLFIADLVGLAQAKTWTKSLGAVDAIAEAIGTFAAMSSVKVDGASNTDYSNADNGIQANTIVVGSTFLTALRKDDDFKALFTGTSEFPSVIGRIWGLDVVYTTHYSGAGFMLLYSEGVAFPYSINTLRAVDSEIFNGVRVQAEVGFPLIYSSEPSILVIDSHAAVFTEALS